MAEIVERRGNFDTLHYYQRAAADDAAQWWAFWAQYHPTGWQLFSVRGGEVPRFIAKTVSRRKAVRAVDQFARMAEDIAMSDKDYTHYEFMVKAKPPRYCSARDITFNGKCLNCGFQPEAIRLEKFKEKKEI